MKKIKNINAENQHKIVQEKAERLKLSHTIIGNYIKVLGFFKKLDILVMNENRYTYHNGWIFLTFTFEF